LALTLAGVCLAIILAYLWAFNRLTSEQAKSQAEAAAESATLEAGLQKAKERAERRRQEIDAYLTEARKAYDAVKKLDSSVSVGVNYMEFGRYLREATFQVDSFDGRFQSGYCSPALNSELKKALSIYTDSYRLWSVKFEEHQANRNSNEKIYPVHPVWRDLLKSYPDEINERIVSYEYTENVPEYDYTVPAAPNHDPFVNPHPVKIIKRTFSEEYMLIEDGMQMLWALAEKRLLAANSILRDEEKKQTR
jgi:hypothetical protein